MEGFVGPQTQRASSVFFLYLKSGYLVFHFLRPTIPPFCEGSEKNCRQSFSLCGLLGTQNAQCRLHSLPPLFRASAEFGQLLHHPNPKLLHPYFRARGALHAHFASENWACGGICAWSLFSQTWSFTHLRIPKEIRTQMARCVHHWWDLCVNNVLDFGW